MLSHLKFEDENYLVVRDLLKRRYQNARVSADTYLAQIFDLPNATVDIRNTFLDPLMIAYRCLEELDLPVSHWSSYVLVHVVLAKLPTDLMSRFEKRDGMDNRELPNLKQLIDFLCASIARVMTSPACHLLRSYLTNLLCSLANVTVTVMRPHLPVVCLTVGTRRHPRLAPL